MKKLLFVVLSACSPPILEDEIDRVVDLAQSLAPELFTEDGLEVSFRLAELSSEFTGWCTCAADSCVISIDPKVRHGYEFLEFVVMHELGHALGLKHVGDWNNVMNTFAVSQITMPEMAAQLVAACLAIECRRLSRPESMK